jgi:group II intron reverse transcriptase/maturase
VALHTKAKGSPSYRFYALYDKIYRKDVLQHAFHRCLANRGVAGVDGMTFQQIEEYGQEKWLDELAEELRQQTYRPQPVLRANIPKEGQPGKTRPLGIPCIRDRVVQMAVVLVLGPIFEADLQPEQYAYRPERSAKEAVGQVAALIRAGFTEVVDADLSGYFDSIPHTELMKSVSRRISDGRILRLIKMWLEAPVETRDRCGRKERTTRNKDEGKGSPQGSPLSPLLSNIYMRRFILGWKTGGHEPRLESHIVNYADDFVICCRAGAAEAMATMRSMMTKLKLTVNETKTRLCVLPDETFDFLGYTFGRCYHHRTGVAYLAASPAKKKIAKLCDAIGEQTSSRWHPLDEGEMVGRLNRKLRGWANDFDLGTVSRGYSVVNHHVTNRLRRWLCGKHKVRGQGYSRYPDRYLYNKLGLYQLSRSGRRFPSANV